MPFLVDAPWFALIPAMAFAVAASWRGGRGGWVAAGAWAIYALYEFGMHQRVLCTGECNIRVDLLLLHPLLLIISLVAAVRQWRRGSGERTADD